MSNVRPFEPKTKPERPTLSSDTALATILVVLDSLTSSDREIVLRDLAERARSLTAPQAGPVLGAILRFLPRKADWTVEEIRQEVAATTPEASQKEIYNALGYLARKGHLERVGYGQYRTDGSLVTSAMDYGFGPVRASEHED